MSDRAKIMNGYMLISFLVISVLAFLLRYVLSSFDFWGVFFSTTTFVNLICLYTHVILLLQKNKEKLTVTGKIA